MVDDVGVTTHTLVLLRHAKADRPASTVDRDRPLSERGRADAATAGEWLVAHHYAPELVLCSPTKRTRQTWKSVVKALPAKAEVWYEEKLYTANVDDLIDAVSEVDDDVGTVLLIGHNPTVSELSERLDPQRAQPSGLRTCELAVHVVSGRWGDCGVAGAPQVAAMRRS